jgi:ABC-2 type transport system permease protein
MVNFVNVVRSGQPVAIFEDPFPGLIPGVPGTSQPKQPGGPMAMFGGGQPEPKGDINQLWDLLGVRINGDQVVWQAYNPYPSAGSFVNLQWVFVDSDSDATQAFSEDDPITSGMGQVLFFYAGGITPIGRDDVNFTVLAVTGTQTGTLPFQAIRQAGDRSGLSPFHQVTNKSYILAAHVTGKVLEDEKLQLDGKVSDEELAAAQKELESEDPAAGEKTKKEKKEPVKFNAVVVSDIDCLSDTFFEIRRVGEEEMFIDWRFQNVTLVLNILDSLAGDDRFIELRKRSRDFRTLTQIEDETSDFRQAAQKEQEKFQKDATAQIEAAEGEFAKKIAGIESRTDLSAMEKQQLLEQERLKQRRQRDVKIKRLEDDRDKQIRQSERTLAANIRSVQDRYKFAAVIVPPILPILLAAWVFFYRRQQEKEGVSKDRLRYGGPDKKSV